MSSRHEFSARISIGRLTYTLTYATHLVTRTTNVIRSAIKRNNLGNMFPKHKKNQLSTHQTLIQKIKINKKNKKLQNRKKLTKTLPPLIENSVVQKFFEN